MTAVEPHKNCHCGRAQEAIYQCGICEEHFCKRCVEFLPKEIFSFMRELPKELSHTQYCQPCYNSQIRPRRLEYNEIMKRAKDVMILDKPRRRPLTILKKFPEPLLVEDCADREETVLRLAFKAAELGFNSVIRANISYRKVGSLTYQKFVWKGTGFAAELDGRKLD